MENKISQNGQDQGSRTFKKETTEMPEATPELIKSWLTKDLDFAVGCINAIRQDEDLLAHMAEWMYGRMMNAKEKKKPE